MNGDAQCWGHPFYPSPRRAERKKESSSQEQELVESRLFWRTMRIRLLAIFWTLCLPTVQSRAQSSWDSLLLALHQPSVFTIDDFLGVLPLDWRGRLNFIPVPESETQGGSYEYPRTVLSTANADVLLTFNGDPAHRGYDRIEVLRFNEFTRRSSSAEIIFPADRVGASREKQRPFIVENPTSCLRCHTTERFNSGGIFLNDTEVMPLMDPYPFWPGWYGSYHDQPPWGQTKEGWQLERFSSSLSSLPRYRHLLLPGRVADYIAARRRNTDLLSVLFEQNSKRMARRLRELPEFERYKYAIFGALLDAPIAQDFLPSLPFANQSYFQTLQDTMASAQATAQRLEQRQLQLENRNSVNNRTYDQFHDSGTQMQVRRAAKLRHLVENRMGHSMRGWSLSIRPDFVFSEGGVYLDTTLKYLAAETAKSDSEIAEIFPENWENTLLRIPFAAFNSEAFFNDPANKTSFQYAKGALERVRILSLKTVPGFRFPRAVLECAQYVESHSLPPWTRR